MKLRVCAPTEIVLEDEAREVVAEALEGSIGILPRHVDYVAVLEPGILLYETPSGEERFLAVDRGLLVKRGDRVDVSVRDAVRGEELADLRRAVRERFVHLDEREHASRRALAQLEARFIRRFLEQSEGFRDR